MVTLGPQARRIRLQAVSALASALTLLGTSGCVPLVVGAGAASGMAVVQERSVGAAIDDTNMRLNIEALMLKEKDSLANKVGVEVSEGRVLLTGAVKSPEDRMRATMIAWRSPGVKEVINEIQVTDKSGLSNLTKDSWITTKLRAKLLTDTRIFDINYSIETVNGVIYLLGIAESQEELNRVINYARNISGVERVVSYVRVKGQQSAPGAAPAPLRQDEMQGDLLPPGGVPATAPVSDLPISNVP